jgi:hypothetical protein
MNASPIDKHGGVLHVELHLRHSTEETAGQQELNFGVECRRSRDARISTDDPTKLVSRVDVTRLSIARKQGGAKQGAG